MEDYQLERYQHTLGQEPVNITDKYLVNKYLTMYTDQKIKVVVASEYSQEDFKQKSETAKSLMATNQQNIQIHIATSNKSSLGEVYNNVIENSLDDDCIIVFMHDDVMILDYFWPLRVTEALKKYDVVGLAGNVKRIDYQPAWGHLIKENGFIWDENTNLTGTVAHGQTWYPDNINYYGPSDQEVKLLDGVFLAAHSKTLKQSGLRFDPQFDFHFYDMDFCRQAELKNLKMGTFPLAIIHAGTGSLGTPEWSKNFHKYADKYIK